MLGFRKMLAAPLVRARPCRLIRNSKTKQLFPSKSNSNRCPLLSYCYPPKRELPMCRCKEVTSPSLTSQCSHYAHHRHWQRHLPVPCHCHLLHLLHGFTSSRTQRRKSVLFPSQSVSLSVSLISSDLVHVALAPEAVKDAWARWHDEAPRACVCARARVDGGNVGKCKIFTLLYSTFPRMHLPCSVPVQRSKNRNRGFSICTGNTRKISATSLKRLTHIICISGIIKAERAIGSEAFGSLERPTYVCGTLWSRTCLAQSASKFQRLMRGGGRSTLAKKKIVNLKKKIRFFFFASNRLGELFPLTNTIDLMTSEWIIDRLSLPCCIIKAERAIASEALVA